MQPMPDNVPADEFDRGPAVSPSPGITIRGPLAHDWYLMHAYLVSEAASTHYADGTPISPKQRFYASAVLSMLKCSEVE